MPGSRWQAEASSSLAARPPTWACTGVVMVRAGIRTRLGAAQAIMPGTVGCDDGRPAHGLGNPLAHDRFPCPTRVQRPDSDAIVPAEPLPATGSVTAYYPGPA
jgi:hypothetical protein